MSSEPPDQVPPPPSGPPPGDQPPSGPPSPPPAGPPSAGPPPPPPMQPYQPAQPGQPYPYAAARPDVQGAMPAMVLGIVAAVLALVGCDCWFIEIVAVPLGIVAIVMGINARNRANAGQGAFGGSGKALTGIITGAVAVALGAIAVVLALAFAGLSGSGILNNLISTPTPT